MQLLYSLGIYLYAFLIKLISPFNPKAKKWYLGRKNFNFDSLKDYKGCILIQCSSLGEYEQGRPLIERLKSEFPSKKIVLSFFSPSGYESKKNLTLVDKVIYLPEDTRGKSSKFAQNLEPEMAFFIKYDFWPNLFNALKQNGCKIFLISTIFREDQLFFKSYGAWYRKTLQLVDFFFVQNKASKELLESIGLTNSLIAGDTRFDQVLSIKENAFSDSTISAFCNSDKNIAIGGSTWLPDELLIEKLISENQNWKWIIAPHEIHKEHIQKLEQLLNKHEVVKFTASPNDEELKKATVLIVDTIGLLKNLYRYGNLAFIGGGFGKGIHNTLEPAVYGIPVLFGPKHNKFQEAQDLLKAKIGFEINTENILKVFSEVTEENYMNNLPLKTDVYISEQKGAIDKIMEYLR